MNDSAQPDPIRGAAAHLVSYAEARLELLQCEWAIERIRLAGLMGTALGMLFFSFLTIVLVVLLIVAWYWDTPMRLTVIGITVAGSLLCALIAAGRYRSKSREPSALFQRSVEEFVRDRHALETLR